MTERAATGGLRRARALRLAHAIPLVLCLVPLLALAVVFGFQTGVRLYYDGGVGAFDRSFEQSVALAASQRAAPEALAFVAAHWRPAQPWRRQLLWDEDVPRGFCSAEATPDGERYELRIACSRIEVSEEPAHGRSRTVDDPDLGDFALAKARWLAARALRMTASAAEALSRIRITQQQERRFGPDAVHSVALDLGDDAPSETAVDAFVAAHLVVVEDTASGLRPQPRTLPRAQRR